MNNESWYVAIGLAFVAFLGVFVWRLFGTANKGIQAVAGTATDVIATVKPITTAVGSSLDGVARTVHAGADLMDVLVDSVRNKQKERVQLAAENADLLAQIEQLKTRRIEARSVEQALEIAFFRVASTYTSFQRKNEDVNSGGLFGLDRPTHHQYIGVLTANFTIKAGVDLNKLTFGISSRGKPIRFHGAHVVQFVGLKDLKISRTFQEARLVYQKTGRREGQVEVMRDSGYLKSAGDLHYDDVLKEIQNSDLASSLADANQKVTQSLFNAIMGVGQYAFEPVATEQPLTFQQLCDHLNSEVNEELTKLELLQRDVLDRSLIIDGEIFNLALAGRGTEGQAARMPTAPGVQ
ncbi:hypothetical protein C7444_1101 [Sphaerotilus hippei]|uniref:Uncharacterized protein n=1 Tax=Sphaerotilus hippei TaxID=744406 RepID=A0A318H6N2_9BURK|nr:hypothetical protein [Sphaerotilus hippei]PXW95156.1 hypothetical protein C7444_1101 [Sphaerotilus hippei]